MQTNEGRLIVLMGVLIPHTASRGVVAPTGAAADSVSFVYRLGGLGDVYSVNMRKD